MFKNIKRLLLLSMFAMQTNMVFCMWFFSACQPRSPLTDEQRVSAMRAMSRGTAEDIKKVHEERDRDGLKERWQKSQSPQAGELPKKHR